MGFVERKRFERLTFASQPLNATVSWGGGEVGTGGWMDRWTDQSELPPMPLLLLTIPSVATLDRHFTA